MASMGNSFSRFSYVLFPVFPVDSGHWASASACLSRRCATMPLMKNEQNISSESALPEAADDKQPAQPAAGKQASPAVSVAEEIPSIDVILASASPRRKQLLEDAGVAFSVHASEVDEFLEPDLLANPPEAVKKLAERKAGATVQEVISADYTGVAAILGADTMVVCAGEIFGKPASLSDAKRMLRRLSGATHEVLTAVSVWMVSAPNAEDLSLGFRTFVDRTEVTFRNLTDEEIADYLRKGESFDKAGAYAIQGEGAKLVERIAGNLDTVIGLPVGRLLAEFPELQTPSSRAKM